MQKLLEDKSSERFDDFVMEATRQIAKALDIPFDLLKKEIDRDKKNKEAREKKDKEEKRSKADHYDRICEAKRSFIHDDQESH
jgi:hypothetical protein